MLNTAVQAVDFHCHLDLFPDFPEQVRACDTAGIATLAVTTTPRAFERNEELAHASTHVRAALGLHPQLVASRAAEIQLFERLLSRTRYVGEIGLDASPAHYASWKDQTAIFDRVLRLCAEMGDKILSVHSVRCVRHVLSALERAFPSDRGQVVLHWFSGTSAELCRAVALGYYFSVNGAMLETNKGRNLVREIPIERLLTESDGPFPGAGGRPGSPTEMLALMTAIASARTEPAEMLRLQVIANLATLVRPSGPGPM